MQKGKRYPCDREWVLSEERLKPVNGPPVRIADVFCGCGGMSLGAYEALRFYGFRPSHAFAVDLMEDALNVLKENFGLNGEARLDDVCEVVPGWPGDEVCDHELPNVDLVLAGPPCQGHSDLNNHTRRIDPRNDLYLKVVRFAELTKPKVVIIENVATAKLAKGDVVGRAKSALETMGYHTAQFTMNAEDVGLPQSRRRLLLVAAKIEVDSDELTRWVGETGAVLRDYISDIADEPEEFDETFRTPSRMTAPNIERTKWLFENEEYDLPDPLRPPCHRDKSHSYKSMYGRLNWDAPAQTLTTGFGSMGQGRFLHPSKMRVITPHEAARIQGFPDFFDFSMITKRTSLHKVIGNAVPPRLAACIVQNLVRLGAFE